MQGLFNRPLPIRKRFIFIGTMALIGWAAVVLMAAYWVLSHVSFSLAWLP